MAELDLILSWSGSVSHGVALALNEWLVEVLPGVRPWVSSEDIEKGRRWFDELMLRLEKTRTCIICITPANLNSLWVIYEAGAIAGKRSDAKVCPYMLGVESIVTGPLAQFQWTKANKEDTWKLVWSINNDLDAPHEKTVLEGNFNSKWPALKRKLERLITDAEKEGKSVPAADAVEAPFSMEAEKILLEAPKDDAGLVLLIKSNGGFSVHTNGKELVNDNRNAREEAAFRSAVRALVDRGLLERRDAEGKTFALTDLGFKMADKLRGNLVPAEGTTKAAAEQLDENDIISILETWMGKRTEEANTSAINVASVDKELKLPPGSAARFLEVAAKRYRYVLERKGAITIKFREGPRPTREAPSW